MKKITLILILVRLKAKITPRNKKLMVVVHLYGQASKTWILLFAIAKKHNLVLIEGLLTGHTMLNIKDKNRTLLVK